MTYNIVVGTTANINFQLLESGAPLDLTSLTVALLLEDVNGATVAPGTVTVVDATTGRVKLVPTDATVFDATKGPYYARWQITDSFAKISFVPSSVRDVWNIVGK